jgi:hypothetical protein
VITPPNLLGYVKASPFRPFRIHMASGKAYDIRHPELIKVGKTYAMIFTPADDSVEVVDSFETASLRLAESISHLEAPVA